MIFQLKLYLQKHCKTNRRITQEDNTKYSFKSKQVVKFIKKHIQKD